MANPLKVLTQLQVSGALNTSGSLSVGGGGSLTVANGLTVSGGSVTLPNGTVANTALANSSVTIGSTSVALGATATTVAGLTSLSATSLTGSLSGSDLVAASVENSKLVNSSVTVTAGDGLTGGGSVSLGGSTSVALSSSVAGNGLGFSSGVLSVNVDDSTIQINSDSLRVKDGGITNTKLANSSVTVGSTSIALGATSTSLSGLTNLSGPSLVISGSQITASAGFSGNGSGLTSLSASQLSNFTDDVRSKITAGTGVTITNGAVSIGQAVATNSNVTFNDVTVAGNLTVNGTTTTVDTENLLVEDAVIQLGSGSAGNADGDRGLIFSRLSENKAFFWDESDSKFKLTATTTSGTTNTIVAGAAQPLEVGEFFFSSSANLGDLSQAQNGSGPFVISSGSNNLQTAFSGTFAALNNIANQIQPGLSANTVNDTYRGLRASGYIAFAAGTTNKIVLALSGAADLGSFQSTQSGEITYASGSTLTGMYKNSQTGEGSMEYQLSYLSVDVAIKASGSNVWTNDLVSVQLSSSQRASDSKYVPVIVIEAPGLGDGGGYHFARIIAVNEEKNAFSVS